MNQAESNPGAVANVAPVCTVNDSPSGGPAVGAPGGAGCPPAGLPCLDTNNGNAGKNSGSENLASVHRKTAYALQQNVRLLVEKYGLEYIGFLTLTFARQIVAHQVAQTALHSLMTGVLKKRYREYIVVMERMHSQRIHYHLLVVLAEDIRTGFEFSAVKKGDYRSANPYLRREWQFWRVTAPKYGFGRTELLPIRKSVEGVAKYLGKYVAKHLGQRLPEDKGARLVRYSRGANRVGVRFSWTSFGAYLWRAKLGTFCRMLGLNADNYQEFLNEWFSRNWVYLLRPLIQEIKLLVTHSPAEVQATYLAVWQVTERERQRRIGQPKDKPPLHLQPPVETAPVKPAKTWAAWIERGLKEEL